MEQSPLGSFIALAGRQSPCAPSPLTVLCERVQGAFAEPLPKIITLHDSKGELAMAHEEGAPEIYAPYLDDRET